MRCALPECQRQDHALRVQLRRQESRPRRVRFPARFSSRSGGRMIIFQNLGEIDIAAVSTFGVSVKEGDNPIGFFGTGLKYAIAVLLRTGHTVAIHSGLTCVDFGLRKAEVRGQEFEFVTMAIDGGKPVDIGFTTQLGKQWEMWMAYREIACNCKDEGGIAQFSNAAPVPTAGTTQIVVQGQDFEAVHADRHKYILEDAPSLSIDT